MRLLVLGHLSDTGFGTVTRELGKRFVEAGVDLRIIAVNHRGEPVKGPLSGRVWPANMYGDPYGGDYSALAIEGSFWKRLDPSDEWKPDAVLVISDVTGLLSHMGRVNEGIVQLWRSIPVYHYCPIEGDNLPPGWRELWNIVRPVAMSDYGQRVISSFLGRSVPRIYHGVDSETFRPVSFSDPAIVDGKRLQTKEACKAHFGMDPKRLLILRSDRNVVRKFYPQLIGLFGEIAQTRDDVDLLMHCRPDDMEGMDLIAEVMRLPEPIRNGQRLWFSGKHDTFVGLTQDGLRALYNAADLYVSTTGGEGFGLTLAESLACEVPVVCTDWAAESEVIGPGGVMVPPLEDKYGEPVRYHSKFGMDWATPDPKAFVEPVLTLLSKPSRRRALGSAGRSHVVRSFNWDIAAAQFVALFEEADAVAA